ncbi:MAG: 50S ribosomal protein L5 [Elusimicrobiota bacterium]
MMEKDKEKDKAKDKQPAKDKQSAKPVGGGKPAADKKKGAGKPVASATKSPTGVIEKPAQPPRLRRYYTDQVVPSMMQDLKRGNVHEVPRLVKIVLNMGVSEAKENPQALDTARDAMGHICGQLPQVRRAKKSISNFKLRQGMAIGVRVTLRGDRMYEFMDRLISVAVPRIRDFRGLETSGFDGRGNYNLGLKEQNIFPEIDAEKFPKTGGLNVTFVTTASNDPDGMELLTRLGMPFRKKGQSER